MHSGALTPDEAVAEVRRVAGRQFDPRIAEVLVDLVAEEVRISQGE